MLEETISAKPSFGARAARRSISLQPDELIRQSFFDEEKRLPLIVEPAADGLNLTAWASANKALIETNLRRSGAILFRGFSAVASNEFEDFIKTVSGETLEYTYRSTPRTRVQGKVYTSTVYPPEMSIPMHNESSYSRNWAMKLFLMCVTAATEQGETPIADSRRMYELIDPEIRRVFMEKNVMYVRNYGATIDLPWQNVFQTSDKEEVENFCRRARIEFEWRAGDRLQTRQICQATAQHPRTGENVWFNQANLFHVAALPRDVRNALIGGFGEENLPRHAFFGDGTRIEPEMIEHINEVYERESVAFRWRAGDVLMLDNMLTAHGRRPFAGERKIVVAMSEPFNEQSIGIE